MDLMLKTLIEARMNNLRNQEMNTYKNEYMRIAEALNNKAMLGLNVPHLLERRKHLHKLGVKALPLRSTDSDSDE